MPSKNPRVNVVLDDHLFRNVQLLAEREGVSLSTKVRDLVKEALEIQEDLYLASFAEARKRTIKKSATLSHEETWSYFGTERCMAYGSANGKAWHW
jgi:predicted DNA-binding protein